MYKSYRVNTKPYAAAAWFNSTDQKVYVRLADESIVSWPYYLLQDLHKATADQLEQIELSPSGEGLHWPALDVDLWIPALQQGLYGTAAWMIKLRKV